VASLQPWWLGDARRSRTEQHRGEEGVIATPAGEGSRETHLLLQLARDTAGGEEEERGSNGIGGNQIEGSGPSALSRGRRENGGGDGVFWLTMELGAVMVEAETHRPGLL
jgi:hypothetical protein